MNKKKAISLTFHRVYSEAELLEVVQGRVILPDQLPTEISCKRKDFFEIYVPDDFQACQRMELSEKTFRFLDKK